LPHLQLSGSFFVLSNKGLQIVEANMESYLSPDSVLAATITRNASKQTYYTIRFLVDDGLVDDAYRAYAYFRWVDDWLDRETRPRAERLAFVERQRALVDSCARGNPPGDLTPEECMLANLIQRHPDNHGGLQAYVRNMMAVMAFDADRRGRLISQRELDEYTRWLAVAVTEALHYFIGHCCASPHGEMRYLAVTGAHITHMLRDALEDAEAGYYNIPRQVVTAHGIAPWDVKSKVYRDWVRERVHQARACFEAGRDYLAQVENLRCRMAGYAYIYRFEVVLDYIEREGYTLRARYPERKKSSRRLAMIGWALWLALKYRQPTPISSTLAAR
jgi:phytoene/squalene synthetase